MKAETDVRVSEPDAGAPEQFAAELTAPPSADASAPKRKRGRPRGATKDPERSARAKRMWDKRRAATGADTPGEPAPTDAPVEVQRAPLTQAELDQAVKEISPLLQMAGAEILDDSFPTRPYTDQDAEQLATALVPVLHKHASFLAAYSAEMSLVVVVLIQANSYRKIMRERKRQAHFENERTTSVIPTGSGADKFTPSYSGPNRFRENNAS